jgi:hypothetical protein
MRGLKVGAPQISLAALRIVRELLIACESRLVSAVRRTGWRGALSRGLATRAQWMGFASSA